MLHVQEIIYLISSNTSISTSKNMEESKEARKIQEIIGKSQKLRT